MGGETGTTSQGTEPPATSAAASTTGFSTTDASETSLATAAISVSSDDTAPSTGPAQTGEDSTTGSPAAQCVVEDFDDEELDPWFLFSDGTIASIADGQLRFLYTGELGSAGVGITGLPAAGRSYEVELVAGPNSMSNAQVLFGIGHDADPGSHLLVIEAGLARAVRQLDGDITTIGSIRVGDMPPRHWRLLGFETEVRWQYSYDEDAGFLDLASDDFDGAQNATFLVMGNQWMIEASPGEPRIERVSSCPY
jgi:hypothetical protein